MKDGNFSVDKWPRSAGFDDENAEHFPVIPRTGKPFYCFCEELKVRGRLQQRFETRGVKHVRAVKPTGEENFADVGGAETQRLFRDENLHYFFVKVAASWRDSRRSKILIKNRRSETVVVVVVAVFGVVFDFNNDIGNSLS